MAAIMTRPLPPDALLARRMRSDDHADCYAVDVAGAVAFERFIEAFYTSTGFLPERLFLSLIGRGGSVSDARQLARGEVDRFAAWRVEAREADQILMLDFLGRTCSWLCVAPLEGNAPATRLYFGSGIISRTGKGAAPRTENWLFRALLPFHAIYSLILLRSAAAKVKRLTRTD